MLMMFVSNLGPHLRPLQALPFLPLDIINHIADHFTAEQWARGPALACKSLRAVRLQQLIIHPGQSADMGLQALRWAMANSQRAKLISLKLLFKSKNLQFNKMLLKALQSGTGSLSQVTAFHSGPEEGQVLSVGLATCQRLLLQRMPNLEVLSLEAAVSGSFSAFSRMKHLALNMCMQASLLHVLNSVALHWRRCVCRSPSVSRTGMWSLVSGPHISGVTACRWTLDVSTA